MMTTARETFRVGQRVKMSQAAYDANLRPKLKHNVYGTVRGFGNISKLLVRVQIEGQKTTRNYHMKFWQKR